MSDPKSITTTGENYSFTQHTGSYIPQGWECPKCGNILSPWTTICPYHGNFNSPYYKINTNTYFNNQQEDQND